MKIGIFNRYWSTMGGGEQNAGSYAAYFARTNDVELIGTENFDVGSRYGRSISRIAMGGSSVDRDPRL